MLDFVRGRKDRAGPVAPFVFVRPSCAHEPAGDAAGDASRSRGDGAQKCRCRPGTLAVAPGGGAALAAATANAPARKKNKEESSRDALV